MGNLGTSSWGWALERGPFHGTEVKEPVGSEVIFYRQYQTELNYRTTCWWWAEWLAAGKHFTHLVTGSVRTEVFCVSSRGDTQEGKTSFSSFSDDGDDIAATS